MKKLYFVLLINLLLFGFNFDVYANDYSKVLTDTATTCHGSECNLEDYTITVSSNDLDDAISINAYSSSTKTYIDKEYQLFLDKIYAYSVSNTSGEIIDFDGKVEILIKDENLVEGTKYNVYYFNDSYMSRNLDKENIGDIAEVVKINGKLYIKLITDTLKTFGIETFVSEDYKEEFKKISKDGYYIFPAIKPQLDIRDGFDFYTFFSAFEKKNMPYKISPAEEYDKNKDYQYMVLSFDKLPHETHVVKYKWKENDVPDYMKKEIKDIEKSIKDNTKASDFGESENSVYFEIEDLNYINYLYNTSNKWYDDDTIFMYSSDIKKTFKYNNFKYYFDFRAGGGNTPFDDHAFGYMLVEKDDLLYSTIMCTVGLVIKPVIYIPDSIKDNDTAYIEAALDRVKKYLQIENVSLKVGGKRSDFEKKDNSDVNQSIKSMWNKYYNEKKLSDNYYILNIEGKEYKFLIEKNTKKSKDIEFITRDIDTNIEINTNGFLPMDSSIEVEHIGKDHKDYNSILDAIKKDFADIYDLKLFSETKDKYITKLDNGKFRVRIPLKDEYKSKNLKVYYVNDEGKKEVYEVIVDGNYAVFETSHFSTYALAVDEEIQIPKTYDSFTMYVIFGFTMLVGTLYIYKIYDKKFNNHYKVK